MAEGFEAALCPDKPIFQIRVRIDQDQEGSDFKMTRLNEWFEIREELAIFGEGGGEQENRLGFLFYYIIRSTNVTLWLHPPAWFPIFPQIGRYVSRLASLFSAGVGAGAVAAEIFLIPVLPLKFVTAWSPSMVKCIHLQKNTKIQKEN